MTHTHLSPFLSCFPLSFWVLRLLLASHHTRYTPLGLFSHYYLFVPLLAFLSTTAHIPVRLQRSRLFLTNSPSAPYPTPPTPSFLLLAFLFALTIYRMTPDALTPLPPPTHLPSQLQTHHQQQQQQAQPILTLAPHSTTSAPPCRRSPT